MEDNVYTATLTIELDVYASSERQARVALASWQGEGSIKDPKTGAVISWDGHSKLRNLRREY